MTSDATAAPAAGPRRVYAILIGITVLFIFIQSITAGEFITDGLSRATRRVWLEVHGQVAYAVMLSALAATAVAVLRMRSARLIVVATSGLFVASVIQWLLGRGIAAMSWDWLTPIHVAFAFVIYGLAILLSIRSAMLRRGGA